MAAYYAQGARKAMSLGVPQPFLLGAPCRPAGRWRPLNGRRLQKGRVCIMIATGIWGRLARASDKGAP
ncbi:hypothetical protein DWUX_2652 [Desulfovibrio diazotrophicus]|nr:hypothetical protein DWUX_2652 [Desulfovibrio diazotrophicus]